MATSRGDDSDYQKRKEKNEQLEREAQMLEKRIENMNALYQNQIAAMNQLYGVQH